MRTIVQNTEENKSKIRHWLKVQAGEPFGPDGHHIPLPVLVPLPKYACFECSEPATHLLEGWWADATAFSIPLCDSHTMRSQSFIDRRREELRRRDEDRRRKDRP